MNTESCPFCGHTKIHLFQRKTKRQLVYYRECGKCGGRGGFAASAEMATEKWDKRYKQADGAGNEIPPFTQHEVLPPVR